MNERIKGSSMENRRSQRISLGKPIDGEECPRLDQNFEDETIQYAHFNSDGGFLFIAHRDDADGYGQSIGKVILRAAILIFELIDTTCVALHDRYSHLFNCHCIMSLCPIKTPGCSRCYLHCHAAFATLMHEILAVGQIYLEPVLASGK